MNLAKMSNITVTDGITKYMNDIKKFPILSQDEEFSLAVKFREYNDTNAAHKLVTSHLRLAASIAMKFRNYGLPMSDLISEANIGLMKAVKKFDPMVGYRLATYAMAYIKSSLYEFVITSWSLVSIKNSTKNKKLFFGLTKAKQEINSLEELSNNDIQSLATKFDVSYDEVSEMNQRRRLNDSSLNAPMNMAKEGLASETERQDYLVDDRTLMIENDYNHDIDMSKLLPILKNGLSSLNERERDIIEKLYFNDNPMMISEIAKEQGVSGQRISQIKDGAINKLRTIFNAS